MMITVVISSKRGGDIGTSAVCTLVDFLALATTTSQPLTTWTGEPMSPMSNRLTMGLLELKGTGMITWWSAATLLLKPTR